MEHLRRRTLHVKKVIKEAFSKTELSDTAEGTCDRYFTVTNSGRLARAATTTSRQQQHTVRSAKAATGKTGRTVSGKETLARSCSERFSEPTTTAKRLPADCVRMDRISRRSADTMGAFHKAERPSAAPPNFSQLSLS